jgi:hypothetical protein
MAEYKIITTGGRFFVTAPSRKQAAITFRQQAHHEDVQIMKIGLHKRREVQSVTSNQRANRDAARFMGKANDI